MISDKAIILRYDVSPAPPLPSPFLSTPVWKLFAFECSQISSSWGLCVTG